MTNSTISPFSSRFFAAVCALVLSSTMLFGAVGPAYNVPVADQAVQGYIA